MNTANNVITQYITLPNNVGLEYRIAVFPVFNISMLHEPDFAEVPPTFKLVYRLVSRNLDGWLYKFIGAEA